MSLSEMQLGGVLEIIRAERDHERRLTRVEERQALMDGRLEQMRDRLTALETAPAPTKPGGDGLMGSLARWGVSKLTAWLMLVIAALIATNMGMDDLSRALLTAAGRL